MNVASVSADDKTLKTYLREKDRLLLSLEEVVNPKHTGLIVVDMQNDFVHDRGKTEPTPGRPLTSSEEMVPNLIKFVQVCRKIGVAIFWIVTYHGPHIDLPAYKARWARKGEGPVVVTEGTIGAEMISEMVPQEEERVVVKHGYDGFTGNDLDICLKNRGIVSLIMSGNSTDICVDATLKHAFHLGYYIVIGSDITATITKGVQDIYLRNFGEYYGLVATSKDIATIWGADL